jgi:hypothetical protein
MRCLLCAAACAALLSLAMSCSSSISAPGDQTLADAAAGEVAYGVENDEATSASSLAKDLGGSASQTSTFSGIVSGSVSVTGDGTWTDQGAAIDPDTGLASPDTVNNRFLRYYGSRTVVFSDYSNLSGQSIESGSVTSAIAEGQSANYQSTTDKTAAYSTGSAVPNYASGLGSQQVQHTVSGVHRTVTGNVTFDRGGKTYTCDIDLTIDIAYRVSFWTFALDGSLSIPAVKARSATISGTIVVNGTAFTIDRSLTKAMPE